MSRSRWLALAMAGSLASPLAGCKALRLTGANAALFFRTPDPVLVQPARVELPGARLAATWIGHATVLVQLDDKFILTDPIFTEYAGAFTRRLVAPGLAVDRLPPLAAVLVSHRHPDHLSPRSLTAIGPKASKVIVPPGAGDDVPAGPFRVLELERWESHEADGLRITAVPVDHSGGRFLDRRSHPRAFTGFVVEYRGLTVYFAGDTAFAPEHFRATAGRFPRIDLALLPIGPISPREASRPNHMDPDDALEAARLLGADAMLPIHHDTFVHSYDAPGDCVEALHGALAAGAPYPPQRVHVLRIGEQRAFPATAPLDGLAHVKRAPDARTPARASP